MSQYLLINRCTGEQIKLSEDNLRNVLMYLGRKTALELFRVGIVPDNGAVQYLELGEEELSNLGVFKSGG